MQFWVDIYHLLSWFLSHHQLLPLHILCKIRYEKPNIFWTNIWVFQNSTKFRTSCRLDLGYPTRIEYVKNTTMAKTNRTEVDLLGEMEIADELFYGIHTQRAIDNFQISNSKIGDFPIFLKGLILTKKACVLLIKKLALYRKTKPKWFYRHVMSCWTTFLNMLLTFLLMYSRECRYFCKYEHQWSHCKRWTRIE